MLMNSPISDIFEIERVPNVWLLGDSAYPLKPWLLTPVLIPGMHLKVAILFILYLAVKSIHFLYMLSNEILRFVNEIEIEINHWW